MAYGDAVRARILAFRPEIVLSANTPLDAQRMLLDATHACGGRFVFWMQDLLSAGMEFVLRKKHFPLAGAASSIYRSVERRILEQSDAIVCIAPEFRAVLDRWHIDAGKVFVIENWAPIEEMPRLPRLNGWPYEHGIEDQFCFMYTGTLGMKHKPELLFELARRFQCQEQVATVVIAEGVGADWLRARQHLLRPGALHILPFQPYRRLPEVLASADVLISLLDEKCGAFAVPSKTLTYLCAGRPILIAAPAENLAARIVERSGAGLVANPVPDELLAAAMRLSENAELRSQCGFSARRYAEQTFAMERIWRGFMQVFAFAMRSLPSRLPVGSSRAIAAGMKTAS